MGTFCQDSIISGESYSLKAFDWVIDTAKDGGGTSPFLPSPYSKTSITLMISTKKRKKKKEDKSYFNFFVFPTMI